MWRQMPTLFSLETIRILKDLAEKVKTSQLVAARLTVALRMLLDGRTGADLEPTAVPKRDYSVSNAASIAAITSVPTISPSP
jgi:hypothetical protein